jgi:two-component system, NarL family, sensor histidine kinase UhpB
VVYRVAQESLTNVVRHAEAANVVVALGRRDGALELRVADDGRGIESDELGSSRGLRGMRERAVYVGGWFSVRRLDPGGTEVLLRVAVGGDRR